MPNTTLSAGDPIEARCTKCRKNTNHIVIAMADEAPAKVECNTCGGQHKYRPPTAAKKAAVKKPATKRTTDPKAAEKKEWATLQADIEGAKAKDYAMTDSYKVRTVVKHAAFGLGLVLRTAGSQKIEVLFADGKKILRCK